MHLHFLKSRSQEPGARSQNRVHAARACIPDLGLRPFLCFHQHLRMHLHFLKSRSQESGVRSQNRRPAVELASDFVLRTRSVCFHQHLRMHLHFLKSRSQKPGVRSQNSRASRTSCPTSDFGLCSFVFIHIPAWNVVSCRAPGLLDFGLPTWDSGLSSSFSYTFRLGTLKSLVRRRLARFACSISGAPDAELRTVLSVVLGCPRSARRVRAKAFRPDIASSCLSSSKLA